MRSISRITIATALFAWSLSANAIPVTFDLAGAPASSVQLTDFDPGAICLGCGVSATLNPVLGSLHRTLDVGQSWEFDFFTLSFYGLGGGSGSIYATLAFDSPTGAPSASGSGAGGFATLFGVFSGGGLTWLTQPGSFSLADGTSYSVTFENLSGLTVGSTNVSGTIRMLGGATSVAVPEPGALGLLGLGLLGLGLSVRRKVY
jgi:hypothetical protein